MRRKQSHRAPQAFLTPQPPSLLFPPERRHSFPSKRETHPGLTSQLLVPPLPATSVVWSFRLSLLAPPTQSHLRSVCTHRCVGTGLGRSLSLCNRTSWKQPSLEKKQRTPEPYFPAPFLMTQLCFYKTHFKGSSVSFAPEHFLLHWFPRTVLVFFSFFTSVNKNAYNTVEATGVNSVVLTEECVTHHR